MYILISTYRRRFVLTHPLVTLSNVHASLALFYTDYAEALRLRGLRWCALSADMCATAHALSGNAYEAHHHLRRHLMDALASTARQSSNTQEGAQRRAAFCAGIKPDCARNAARAAGEPRSLPREATPSASTLAPITRLPL
jgi:hypothetical protein